MSSSSCHQTLKLLLTLSIISILSAYQLPGYIYGEVEYNHGVLDPSYYTKAYEKYAPFPGFLFRSTQIKTISGPNPEEVYTQYYTYYYLYAFHYHKYTQNYSKTVTTFSHSYSYFTRDHSYHMNHSLIYTLPPHYSFTQTFNHFYKYGDQYSQEYSYKQRYEAFTNKSPEYTFDQAFSHRYDNHAFFNQHYAYEQTYTSKDGKTDYSFKQDYKHEYKDADPNKSQKYEKNDTYTTTK